MRTRLAAAAVVVAAALAQTAVIGEQARGMLTNVTIEPAEEAGSYLFVVRGRNPCNSIRLNAGEGPHTFPIYGLPTTLPHNYTRTGNFTIRAEGLGTCSGSVSATLNVTRVASTAQPLPGTGRNPVNTDWSETRFHALDRNGDGRITMSEWRFGADEFARVDRNRDAMIVLREYTRGADAPPPVGQAGTPTRQIPPGAIVVSARTAWTDSGVSVRLGDLINVRSEGEIQWGPENSATAGPGGVGGRAASSRAPVPTVEHAALIGRIGSGAPFLIGNRQGNFQAPNTGRLYLGINDDILSDNAGEFFVVISVSRNR